MIIVNILFLISLLFINIYKTKRHLHMMQQNLYNENNRYIRWILKNSKQFISIEFFTIIVTIIAMFIKIDTNILLISTIIVISIIFLVSGLTWKKLILTDQNKKKLVITARVKRLIFTIFILYLIPVVFLVLYNLLSMLLVLCIMTYLNAFVVFIAMIINTPIEKLVYLYYKSKAQRKLKSMSNLKIIGITGSYGKTSSKNILSDILNIKYNALPTPKNLNTFNGLIMTVNNHMDKFTDIFIAEMGAYVKGEINGLCKLVNPKYGIITKIGTAHLETFGSEENIQSGKMELIEYLPEDGVGVLNRDDEKQKNYKFKNKNHCKLLWVGIDTKDDVDVRASKIKVNHEGTTFTVEFKGDKKKYEFKTRLLGKHNVYNIISCLALGYELGINVEHLQRAVGRLKPIEHRLSMKNFPKFVFIDDAYNSNPEGSKRALEVLNMMDGYKVVVTPGMIELGDKEEYYNKEFGKDIAEVADHVILVGEKQTKPILEGLKEKGFKESDIEIINDVTKAYMILNSMKTKKKIYALFENDLPDTYNEK